MPFRGRTMEDERREFVRLAMQVGSNRRELCRRFGISPTTGYRWLARGQASGLDQLACHSRRPHTSPGRTPATSEARILALRDAPPTWGARKLRAALRQRDDAVPASSTITAILHRHQRIAPPQAGQRTWHRFEHPAPNDLWQIDFMGHRPLRHGRVHPLTILDDHSRYGLALTACAHERSDLVQAQLIACFERYGLPWAMLADHGPPWGTAQGLTRLTRLAVWLMRLGISMRHGRPRHPQTQGKIERWHRTIASDVFGVQIFADCADAQRAFDQFRHTYNAERPHEAVHLHPPGSRYQGSPRSYPAILPEPVYDDQDALRKVRGKGEVHFAGRRIFLGEGLAGQWVGIRPTLVDSVYDVRFCHQVVGGIDLTRP